MNRLTRLYASTALFALAVLAVAVLSIWRDYP